MDLEDLPNLEKDVQSLKELVLSAVRDTTVDWSNTPLWKILATTSENPFGLSKIGARRYQKGLEKRRKGKLQREATRKRRERVLAKREKRRKFKTTPKGILERLKEQARQDGVGCSLTLKQVESLISGIETTYPTSQWNLERRDKKKGWDWDNLMIKLI